MVRGRSEGPPWSDSGIQYGIHEVGADHDLLQLVGGPVPLVLLVVLLQKNPIPGQQRCAGVGGGRA